jgi:hypothetical protein
MIIVRKSILDDETIESANEFSVIQKAIDADEILEPADLQTIVDNIVNVHNLKTEVETARSTFPNLKGRLDDHTTQLAETVKEEAGWRR